MTAHQDAAVVIMGAFHQGEDALLDRPVIKFDGEGGTVIEVKADAQHGLLFAFMHAPKVFWPVSTIKFVSYDS